jgi:hypothetical protein
VCCECGHGLTSSSVAVGAKKKTHSPDAGGGRLDSEFVEIEKQLSVELAPTHACIAATGHTTGAATATAYGLGRESHWLKGEGWELICQWCGLAWGRMD